MFTRTLSIKDEYMGLKYYSEEVSPLYANTSIPYPSPPSLSAAVNYQ
jgi:hypothetical protein